MAAPREALMADLPPLPAAFATMPNSHYTGLAGQSYDHPAQAGVLLVNLGTPDAPTARAVRPYLAQFLSDPRVIEYPRWLWWLILHGVILRIRPARSAHAYARIWTPAGSPLRVGSEQLAAGIQAALQNAASGPVRVALAMRYGEPSVRAQIEQMLRDGVRRLLVLPLYPQYSGTSTGSVIDAVADAYKTLRWPPELRIVNDYHDDAGHIEALAQSIEHSWMQQGRGERLLLSFHGIPQRYVDAGDPYLRQCQATAHLLRARLRLDPSQLIVSFQSRVGREPWLQPYTDETVKRLAREGVKRLDVACPGFAVDCLETLEEIAMQNSEFFRAAGGESLRYIPALNDSDAQIQSLVALIQRHAQGWPEFSASHTE